MRINDTVSDIHNSFRRGIVGALQIHCDKRLREVFVEWNDGTESWTGENDLVVIDDDKEHQQSSKDK